MSDNLEPLPEGGVLSKRGACRFLADISERALMEHVYAGRLNAKLLGSRVVFEVSELRRFIEGLPPWEPAATRGSWKHPLS